MGFMGCLHIKDSRFFLCVDYPTKLNPIIDVAIYKPYIVVYQIRQKFKSTIAFDSYPRGLADDLQ